MGFSKRCEEVAKIQFGPEFGEEGSGQHGGMGVHSPACGQSAVTGIHRGRCRIKVARISGTRVPGLPGFRENPGLSFLAEVVHARAAEDPGANKEARHTDRSLKTKCREQTSKHRGPCTASGPTVCCRLGLRDLEGLFVKRLWSSQLLEAPVHPIEVPDQANPRMKFRVADAAQRASGKLPPQRQQCVPVPTVV